MELMSAQTFCSARVGYAGSLSQPVRAFRVLLREPAADPAFKYLVAHGTPAGQLYGLCGVYFTDHKFFLDAVERFRGSAAQVRTQIGCINDADPIGPLVASKHPDALRLTGPDDSVGAWMRRTGKKTYFADILGGAYPFEFANK